MSESKKLVSYVEECEAAKQHAETLFWYSVDQVSSAERSNSIESATVWARREEGWQNVLHEIRRLMSRKLGPHGIEPKPIRGGEAS